MGCPLQFYTNSEIEFSKISLDQEVERQRGRSIFDESHDDKNNQTSLMELYNHADDIESMYTNAQMILDDLAARPLTNITSSNGTNSRPQKYEYNVA